MAKTNRQDAPDATDATGSAEAAGAIDGERTLTGMPGWRPGEDGDESDGAKRPAVPKELRPLFNEVARLSGFLSMARRAIYDGQPDRVARALALLEKSVPDAREIAELSAP